ncbi:phosphatase PAP2 family protein [Methylobacter sp. Wu1]|uniref:phosphatase PAP2 family protein n=1 Tax=Methylobacter sp. Wu1 TaxID=3119359 RepID=UPI002F92EC03
MTLSKLTTTLVLWLMMVVLLLIIEHFSSPPFLWDKIVLTHISQLRSLWLDRLFLFFTHFGSLYFLMPVTAFIIWFLIRSGHSGDAWFLALSLGGASLIAHLAKYLFQRVRPDEFPFIGTMPLNASFPSAHTAQVMAFVITVYLILRRLDIQRAFWFLVIAAPVAVMVALSRLYLQVHYPSDVLAGLVLALLWIMGVAHLLNTIGIRVT